MSQPTSNCPNCGAPVQFRWSSAVQTACPFCKSIIIRRDLVLTNVGQVADLPPDPSPIQLLTEGVYNGKKFQVTGRLVYEYEQGNWNEWHIVFSDGASGWLSDAQLTYAVSFLTNSGTALPTEEQISRGKQLHFQSADFEVSTMTVADIQRIRRRASVSVLRKVRHAVRRSAHVRSRFRNARLQ